jgi:D-arginine dehydrogenase
MTPSSFDIIIIGGGIAGASAGAWLSETQGVCILERESQPGYHATGRSAALFSELYGNGTIRPLSRASRAFFLAPPPGFAEQPLVNPRGALHIARADQVAALDAFALQSDVRSATLRLDAAAARTLSPLLRPGYVAAAIYEPQAYDIDVHALHSGFLRMFRSNHGRIVTQAEVLELRRMPSGRWQVQTNVGCFEAGTVINAAGAWADDIARRAGVLPLGMAPLRRTVVVVDVPKDLRFADSPLTIDIDEAFYFKPETGRLLISPCDQTPCPPCDAQADELDVAMAVHRIEAATVLKIDRLQRKWAGLRTFSARRSPVVGYDAEAEGFFWLAGQGGYGIQTAPALGRLAAALAVGRPVPDDLAAFGVDATELSPEIARRALPHPTTLEGDST